MTIARRTLAALASGAASSAGAAQKLGGAPSADVSLVRVFLALLVSLLLALVAVLFVRQRFTGRPVNFLSRLQSRDARIRLVESRRISTQAEVSLVQCDDAEYLLLVGPGGLLLLSQRPAPAGSVEAR